MTLLLGIATGSGCRSAPRPLPNPGGEDASRPAAIAGPTASASSSHDQSNSGDLESLVRLFRWSEPGETFLSDNLVSNETSYLGAASALVSHSGGVYLGVGPEQNLSYIAFARPELALIVDLRRDNALLHLLYQAIFETAPSREQFLGLLLGRPGIPLAPPGSDAHSLLAAVEQRAPDHGWFVEHHAALEERIRGYGLGLSPQDFVRIRKIHEQFFVHQLDLRFELHRSSGRVYPTLAVLLGARDEAGHGSFLATEEGFAFVRSLERRHRVIPIVGNLAAREPLGRIAGEMRARGLRVNAWYTSNVEQYLMGTPAFEGWLKNLRLLPTDDASVLVRSYLDQGRRHPRQAPRERTTTLVHSLERFLARSAERPYSSYYALAADASLLVGPGQPK